MVGPGIILSIFLWLIGLVILMAVIRYAIDSSKTSSKLEDLLHEVRMLRNDIKNQDNK
ncbi:MAG: hypothetical protein JWM44_3553 [Bacilli bacterium]|jgi:hypothetical protein|nr:hypothetical protein [Bacilli bacterium]